MHILAFVLDFKETIISFLLWVDSVIFSLFGNLYESFINLTYINIFTDGAFDSIANNVYVIIGVVALFILAFMLLKMMINPDSDKGGKLIFDMLKRLVLAVAIIALVPTMFAFLSDIQTSLIAYNVVPNFILGSNEIQYDAYDEDGNYLGKQSVNMKTGSKILLRSSANAMVVRVIEGLMYPINEDGQRIDDLTVDVSDFLKSNTKPWLYNGIACGIGAVAIVALTYGTTLPMVIYACAGGTIFGNILSTLGNAVTAHEYTWSYTKAHMAAYGDFNEITLFANAIQQGDMHYTPIVSTIVAGFLAYMIASFCIDIVIRSAKLAFYELIAPLCMLLSIMPNQKDLIGKWFKVSLTTWAELFVRVATMCSVALLVGSINFDDLGLSIFHPIISTFVICGLVLFAKQLPKLIGDLTGINSNNMKLNLKEKLAEGGAFAVGGIIVGGAERLSRGVTRKVKNHFEQDENGRWHKKDGTSWKKVFASGVGGVITSIPSVIRTQIGSGINGYKAKNFKDMISGADKANAQVEASMENMEKYIADHGGTIKGVSLGLLSSGWAAFQKYVGLEPDYSELKKQKEALDDIAKLLSEIKKVGEEYIDKHMHEYYVEGGGLTKKLIGDYNQWKKQLDEETKKEASQQDTKLIEKLDKKIKGFEGYWENRRLDVLKAQTTSAQTVGETPEAYSRRIANATKDFNEARKKLVDSFVTDAPGHLGAELETINLSESIKTINKQLQDYSNTAVVKAFHDGVQGVFDATKDVSTKIGTEEATAFIKNLKKATEVTNSNIERMYNDLQRKNKNNNGGKS